MEKQARSMVASILLVLLSLSLTAPSVRCQTVATAPAPAAAPAKTIRAVLTKAGQFTKFLQLLKSTQEEDQIDSQLKGKASSGGFTVFAPTDNAFTSLKSGSLNALSDQEKTSLVQFHVLSQLLPMAQFDTVSNPLRTQAGDTGRGKYPLNVTADGAGRVNISTGVVNATVDSTLFTGDRLVVYQVDKVLLPWKLYGPPVPPAPAPSPAVDKDKKKAGPVAVADGPEADSATASEAAPRGMRGLGVGLCGVAVAVAAAWCGM
ncbi:fasciclin-like arabinogalactan protein 11 [Lolium rigidum]|uniref:fasciclin-like arabinogalactan protein 11 n=1 Tax=Lolium rigidum TaxID=89674 RepID=UPI001F5C2020|nr:fasciclin-like arabinogalactan protein 11 [Lolium rigidum]